VTGTRLKHMVRLSGRVNGITSLTLGPHLSEWYAQYIAKKRTACEGTMHVIETERLTLRPFAMEDLDVLHRMMFGNTIRVTSVRGTRPVSSWCFASVNCTDIASGGWQ
jgi:hypothetical protein